MENKVRVVHSWWSLPMRQGRWNSPNQIENSMYITALSLSFAKKNGAYMVCYCDKFLEPYLSKFGYDELHVTLDKIEEDLKGDCVFMWAAGKFYSMQNEPLGAVHIDFDVFLTKPECVEALRINEYDFIYSHIENSTDYVEKKLFKDMFPTVDTFLNYACNVGVIGFNNQEAKDEYFNHYLNYFKNNTYDMNGDKDLNADLLLEQTYLYQMLLKYNGKWLIGDQQSESAGDLQRRSVELGFEHLLGRTKYQPFIMKNVKKRLKNINPELFDEISKMKF